MEFLSSLIEHVRAACADFPDERRGKVRYSMADIGLSAFSLFFMQSESFLSYQRSLEEGRKTSNCRTLFGMAAIPTDNHIRAMLDPVHPSHLQPAFDGVLDTMHRRDGFAPFRRLCGRVLIALDGTEYFCSQKLGCPQCLTRKRANGKVESFHSMLCGTVVAPRHTMALPLMPEFIAPWDGAEKQDRERNAVRRWLATHTRRVGGLRPVFHKVPLRDGTDAQLVDWIGVTIADAKGKTTYQSAFVTSLDVTRDSVAEIVACAMARWKIENENFNVLKSNGYHLEHNFGHDKKNLAMVSAALNMPAFAVHTVCDCLEQVWVEARTTKRARHRFFELIRTITAYLVFPDWNTLIPTLIDSKPPPEIEAQIAR